MGVAARDTVDEILDFVDVRNVDGFTHAIDADAEIWAHFGVFTQPAFAFISADGDVDVVLGGLGTGGLKAKLEENFAL